MGNVFLVQHMVEVPLISEKKPTGEVGVSLKTDGEKGFSVGRNSFPTDVKGKFRIASCLKGCLAPQRAM